MPIKIYNFGNVLLHLPVKTTPKQQQFILKHYFFEG